MILEGLLTILQSLVGWLLLIIFQMLLRIVSFLEKFFDVFAGTAPVYLDGKESYLFDLFFSNKAITKLFWAMAIIAILLNADKKQKRLKKSNIKYIIFFFGL